MVGCGVACMTYNKADPPPLVNSDQFGIFLYSAAEKEGRSQFGNRRSFHKHEVSDISADMLSVRVA